MSNLIIIVRKDIMKPGKAMTQVAHACIGLTNKKGHISHDRAITYKVMSLTDLEYWQKWAITHKKPWYMQVDAGLTQIPADTPTVLVIAHINNQENETFKCLKLY